MRLCLCLDVSSLQVKHKPMQILSKCKYHIYMLERHIRMNRADTEGGKLPGNTRLHLSPSLLTIRLVLVISRPSGHSRQEGREPQQNRK